VQASSGEGGVLASMGHKCTMLPTMVVAIITVIMMNDGGDHHSRVVDVLQRVDDAVGVVVARVDAPRVASVGVRRVLDTAS